MANDVNERSIGDVISATFGLIRMQTQGKNVGIPYWRGAPGIGKTTIAEATAVANDMNFMGTHYALRPIEEISGLPNFTTVTVNGAQMAGTVWTFPDILTELYKLAANGKPTVWLLDDFHLASPAIMNLGYEMFSERRLRGFEIPPNVGFLLAGNMSAKAGSKKNLTSAVANRCCIMNVKMGFNEWKRNFALATKVNSKIINFLSQPKSKKFFQEEEQLDRPWASARSWTRFSEFLNPWEADMPMSMSDVLYYAESHIGTEAASEFAVYYKIFSEIEMDKIFNKELPIKIPDDMSKQYIYALASVSEFIKRYIAKDPTGIDIMSDIIIEIAKQKIEIAITALKEIVITEQSLKLRDCYFPIKKMIMTKDMAIGKKIEIDIKHI